MSGAIRAALSAVLSTPDPRFVRRYGLAIVLALGLPKIVWDIWRLRTSRAIVVGSDADARALTQKDPVLKVLNVTVAKAVMDLREAWKVCFRPYCEAAPQVEDDVETLLCEAEGMVGEAASNLPSKNSQSDKNEDLLTKSWNVLQ